MPTLEHFEAEWQALEAKAKIRAIARAQHFISRSREVIAQYREKIEAQTLQAVAAAQAAAEAEQIRAQKQEAAAIAAGAEARRPAERAEGLERLRRGTQAHAAD